MSVEGTGDAAGCRPYPISCYIVSSGVSNIVGRPNVPLGRVSMVTESTLFEDLGEFIKLSPLLEMDEVQARVMLIVGDQDIQWIEQMINQFIALRWLGKDVTFIRYQGEGHIIRNRRNVEDLLRRQREFVDECSL